MDEKEFDAVVADLKRSCDRIMRLHWLTLVMLIVYAITRFVVR